jgi:hypothetical protein
MPAAVTAASFAATAAECVRRQQQHRQQQRRQQLEGNAHLYGCRAVCFVCCRRQLVAERAQPPGLGRRHSSSLCPVCSKLVVVPSAG